MLLLTAPLLLASELPSQKDVFTVFTLKAPNPENYLSNSYLYSVLPLYEKMADGERPPWHKYRHNQQGIIVLKDKRVLFFSTQNPKFLTVRDSKNKSTDYVLKTKPKKVLPVAQSGGAKNPFPAKKENVFCVAMFPWTISAHARGLWPKDPTEPLTPEQFITALEEWNPYTEKDVPERAIWAQSSKGKVLVPKVWMELQKTHRPVSGVVVGNDRSVALFLLRGRETIAVDGKKFWRNEKAVEDQQ